MVRAFAFAEIGLVFNLNFALGFSKAEFLLEGYDEICKN